MAAAKKPQPRMGRLARLHKKQGFIEEVNKAPDCEHHDNRSPVFGRYFCRFYKEYFDLAKCVSCNHDSTKEISKKKYVYIIEPHCHGNGGWCGFGIVGEYKSVKAALRTKPRWEPVYSPYGGSVLNKPRMSLTPDPNDAIYIFDWDMDKWEESEQR
jgi:hypothetical protein